MFNKNEKKAFVSLLLLLLFLITFLLGNYSQWTDRDLFRGLDSLHMFDPMGAELSFHTGNRIPGGLMNYLWGFALSIHDSFISVFILQNILIFATLALLFFFFLKEYNFYSSSFLTIILAIGFAIGNNGVWNPTMALPFTLLSFLFVFLTSYRNDNKLLKYGFLFCFMAMQMHLSMTILLVGLIYFSILRKINLKEIACIVLFFIINYSLYIYYEFTHNFINTSQLIEQIPYLSIKWTYVLGILALTVVLFFIKNEHKFKLAVGSFLLLFTVSFLLSIPTEKMENKSLNYYDISLNAKSICEQKPSELKCIELNDIRKNLNFIYDPQVKNSITAFIEESLNKGLYTEVFFNNVWDNRDYKYENVKGVIGYTPNPVLIYTSFGEMKPSFNFQNIKSIISFSSLDEISLFSYPIFLFIFIFGLKFISNKEKEVVQFLLVNLIIYIVVFGQSYSIDLNRFNFRYILISFICVSILTSLSLFNIFSHYYHKNEKLFKQPLFRSKPVFFVLLIVANGILSYKVFSRNYYSDTENLVKQVMAKTDESFSGVYYNLALMKDRNFVMHNEITDFLAKDRFGSPNKKSNYCYLATTDVIENIGHIEDAYSYPRKTDFNFFDGVKHKEINFDINKQIKATSINLILSTPHKIRNSIKMHNVYKIGFDEPIFCPRTFSNRYALTDPEKEQLTLLNQKEKNSDIKISKDALKLTYSQSIDNNAFVYSLNINLVEKKIRIDSNQLRGMTYNLGFFKDYTLFNPKITINSKEYKDPMVIGIYGVMTPYIFDFSNLDLNNIETVTFEYDLFDSEKYKGKLENSLMHFKNTFVLSSNK